MADYQYAFDTCPSSRDQMNDTSGLDYRPGDLFLGVNSKGQPIGVKTQQHALTFGSAGAGKGAAILIPNLLKWPHNVLVIDPKGSNAANTIAERARAGHNCYVIDPYGESGVPERYRATFNPLADLDPDSATFSDDCDVIGDGLIVRSDPRHEEWYSGAAKILGGLIAFAAFTGGKDATLADMRMMLLQDNDGLRGMAGEMLESHIGTIRAAGSSILTGLDGKGVERDCLAGAKRATSWLDSPPIAEALGRSTFRLSDLKTGDASIYLVMPFRYLQTKAGFLRLFVQCAIHAMQASLRGRRCLFLLDEFYSLGRMDEIATGFGTMREYNLQIWAFMQDMTQLRRLYGDLAGTFLANSAVHNFIGATEPTTVEHLSKALGTKRWHDASPPRVWKNIQGSYRDNEHLYKANDEAWREWRTETRHTEGQPIIRPDELARLLAVPPDRPCEQSVNIVYGSRAVVVQTQSYWEILRREQLERIHKEEQDRLWAKEQKERGERIQREQIENLQIMVDMGLPYTPGVSGLYFLPADQRAIWPAYKQRFKAIIEARAEREFSRLVAKIAPTESIYRRIKWADFIRHLSKLEASSNTDEADLARRLYAELEPRNKARKTRARFWCSPLPTRWRLLKANGFRLPGAAI